MGSLHSKVVAIFITLGGGVQHVETVAVVFVVFFEKRVLHTQL